ncbi:SAM-dependent methyltransferase [Actinomadura fibrosa]|uniref:SAM-dependent methyltransferase n=1 Tax=Actinomadura fibrosa TaxID=111802 RepID=A0ABW2XTT8_9ACTN|nr:class I SAM-dependent methyltransferase [Actinomadura fibrosa]
MEDVPQHPADRRRPADRPDLADHPDRLRWNAKYESGAGSRFAARPLAERALARPLPDGPVLDLASGPSGSALLAAQAGRRVTAVDISEVALGRLLAEARRRGVEDLVTAVEADLGAWRPGPAAGHALVLCLGYWDRGLFGPAAAAVMPGGVLAWEAFTLDARRDHPSLPTEWCLGPGEPASLLPGGFTVLEETDVLSTGKRRLLAERRS